MILGIGEKGSDSGSFGHLLKNGFFIEEKERGEGGEGEGGGGYL